MTSITPTEADSDREADIHERRVAGADQPVAIHEAPHSQGRRSALKAVAAGGAGLFSARIALAHSGSAPSGQPVNSDDQPSLAAADNATTADVIVQTLLAWDVDHVFGMVGDGINPLIEALRQHQDKIRFIGVRHEEAAAFMASGWAKATGRLGVCLATIGPGAVHLMNGLYDALGGFVSQTMRGSRCSGGYQG
jgi:pyruvate dehydrogenase (quinone)